MDSSCTRKFLNKDLLNKYYSPGALESHAARAGWIISDLQPSPETLVNGTRVAKLLTRLTESEKVHPIDEFQESSHA